MGNSARESMVEGSMMSAKTPFIGLCVTCNNADTCVYRKLRGCDAIYCEMFDGYAPPKRGSLTDRATRPIAAESTEVNGRKGLCINCAHADTCMLPKPAGGVWHCEEYE
jgi:hypothetical protein